MPYHAVVVNGPNKTSESPKDKCDVLVHALEELKKGYLKDKFDVLVHAPVQQLQRHHLPEK